MQGCGRKAVGLKQPMNCSASGASRVIGKREQLATRISISQDHCKGDDSRQICRATSSAASYLAAPLACHQHHTAPVQRLGAGIGQVRSVLRVQQWCDNEVKSTDQHGLQVSSSFSPWVTKLLR